MPMPLPPTPWIKDYDWPGDYIRGFGAGVQGGEVRQRGRIAAAEVGNRLAIASLEAQTRKEIAEKSLLAEEHRRAIQEAYDREKLQMEKQKLEQESRMNEVKILQAAREAAATMRAQQMIDAGVPAFQAFMATAADRGISGGDMAQMAHAQAMMTVPENIKTWKQGGHTFYESPGRGIFPITERTGSDWRTMTDLESMKWKSVQDGLDLLDKTWADNRTSIERNPGRMRAMNAQRIELEKQKKQIEDLAKARAEQTGAEPSVPQSVAAPAPALSQEQQAALAPLLQRKAELERAFRAIDARRDPQRYWQINNELQDINFEIRSLMGRAPAAPTASAAPPAGSARLIYDPNTKSFLRSQ